MSDERKIVEDTGKESDYETPAIEEVVTREGLEREVAYAGVIGPSQTVN
jgi:hypothetical protein